MKNRCPQATYIQRQGQIQSWTPEAVRTNKRKENFSQQPQEQQIKSPKSTWGTLHLWNTWIDNKATQNEAVDFGGNCRLGVCCLVLTCFWFFMFILVQLLVLVIIGGFVYWFGSPLLFLLLFYFTILLFFILIILLYFLRYFIILLSFFFFSPFSSEPCGWQGLGDLAWCQA